MSLRATSLAFKSLLAAGVCVCQAVVFVPPQAAKETTRSDEMTTTRGLVPAARQVGKWVATDTNSSQIHSFPSSFVLPSHHPSVFALSVKQTHPTMPSVQHYNQTAPWWDLIASLEEQVSPGNHRHRDDGAARHGNNERVNRPFGQPWGGFPFGPAGRGGRHAHGHSAHGHSAPESREPGDESSAPAHERRPEHDPSHHHPAEAGPPHHHPAEAGPPHHHPAEGGPPHHSHARGRHFRGGRGDGRGRGRGGGPPHHQSDGPGGFPMDNLAAVARMFRNQVLNATGEPRDTNASTFTPEIDLFDTAGAYVLHVALPGAKKEDVNVTWEHERSELMVSGIVHRPGDEKFLKTLAMDERKVGTFERKIRLGSRVHPAQVDAEGISAKMEDGVLRIGVPKMESGFVEVTQVDVE